MKKRWAISYLTLEAKTFFETIYYLIRRKIAAGVLLKEETEKHDF